MSFGILSMKKKKEDEQKELVSSYKKHVVVGNNYEAVYGLLRLVKKYGEENVLLVTSSPLNGSMIKEQLKCILPTVRDEQSAELLRSHFPFLEIIPSQSGVSFYKDGKFHQWGGKAKPMPLLEGEEFFANTFYQVKIENLFEQEWELVEKLLENNQSIKYINEIEKTQPTDLVEPVNMKLKTADNEIVSCEELYWFDSPKHFLGKLVDKSDVSDKLIEFVGSQRTLGGLVVHFECDGMAHEKDGTYLLPQSLTHEWGHFVCNIDKYDPAEESQKLTCMMIIRDEDDMSEEDLAKKVRLMKRVMERSMDQFKGMKFTEYIYYNDELLFSSFNDDLSEQIIKEENHFHLLGSAGLVHTHNVDNLQYFSRSMMTFQNL